MTNSQIKIEEILGMLTIRLGDTNYSKWAYQFRSVLRGYKLFDHFDGTSVCPPRFVIHTDTGVTKEITVAFQEWEQTDLALLSLLIATLTDDAIDHVLGCKTAYDAWSVLEDRYATVSKSRINMLKTEFQTLQKGTDSIDKFLSRLKSIRDQLIAAGEAISYNDLIIAALAGLPREYAIIRTVILARETSISLKEFRAQLLNTERDIDSMEHTLSHSMAALYMQGSSSTSGRSSGSSSHSPPNDGLSSATVGIISPGSFHPTSLPHQFPLPPPDSSQHSSSYGYGFGYTGNASSTYHSGHRPFNTQRNNFGGQQRGGFRYYNKGRNSNSTNRQGGWQSWSGNTDTRFNMQPECQICQRRGHTAPNCYHRNPSSNQVHLQECQICGKRGHIALDCYHRGNFAYQGAPPPPSLQVHQEFPYPSSSTSFPGSSQPRAALHAMQAQHVNSSSPNDVWVVDTGASHHMTSDVHNLAQAIPFEGSDRIKIGNGQGQGNKGDLLQRQE